MTIQAPTPVNEVQDFWFGELGVHTDFGAYDQHKTDLWFANGKAYDGAIRRRFGDACRTAAQGHWDNLEGANAVAALIIMLDQFPRHIFRGDENAWSCDSRAQSICQRALRRGVDAELHPIQRVFFYLPLEHAEDIAMQRMSVACFSRLAESTPAAWKHTYNGFLDYARRHHDVIERFGRFPHRNAILGRPSSHAEKEFLKQPGSSF